MTSCSPLARNIVAGKEDAGSVESVFEQARQVAAEALPVDEGWHAPEPEPVAAELVAVGAGADDLLDYAPERQRSLFSWAEFMAGDPAWPQRRRGAGARTLSLSEWAFERERDIELADLAMG